MTDKEVEKIAEARLAYILLNWKENWDNTTLTIGELSHRLLNILKDEFGYRKVSGEPPVLSDKEIKAIEAEVALKNLVIKSKDEIRLIKKRAVAQAQRDADIRYYSP